MMTTLQSYMLLQLAIEFLFCLVLTEVLTKVLCPAQCCVIMNDIITIVVTPSSTRIINTSN